MTSIENNMSEGSVFKKLVLFSLPFLLSNIIQSLYGIADMLIVGKYCGTESMSGVNIGGQITFILTFVAVGICMGATVLIGQYVGAGNEKSLKKVTSTVLTLLLIIAVVITVLMLVFKGSVLKLIQTPEESYAESDSYLTVTVTGIIFIFGYNALSAIMRGMGDSKRPFYFITFASVLSIALDFVFVVGFGWAAFGAALSTVIAQGVSMFLCIWYMIKKKFLFDFKPSSFRIDREQLKLICKIGLPSCVQNCVTSISFLFITAIVNVIGGVSASAAVGAVGKFVGFAIMPAMAMSASISTVGAQNIGAGKLDRAIKACKIGTVFSVVVCFISFVLVQIFPAQIVGFFGDDPQMIENGVTYMISISYDFLLIPFIFCINGLFMGGGHTMFTLINSMLSAIILRVPACYILGNVLGWGLSGVGMGAPIASAGSLILILIFIASGKWKHNVIKGNTPGAEPVGAQ